MLLLQGNYLCHILQGFFFFKQDSKLDNKCARQKIADTRLKCANNVPNASFFFFNKLAKFNVYAIIQQSSYTNFEFYETRRFRTAY